MTRRVRQRATRRTARWVQALAALETDAALCEAFGAPLIGLYTRIKRSELERHRAATDPDAWMRREYFSRF